MKKHLKNLIVVTVLVSVLLLPVVAQAKTSCNIKVTINGQSQVLQIPVKDTASLTKTLRFTFTLKDGKWVLVQNPSTEATGSEEPKTPVEPPKDDKPIANPPKTEEPTNPPKNPPVNPPKTEKPTDPEKTNQLTGDEKKMLELVNAERQKAGLSPLKIDMRLVDVSRKKSKDMIDKNYFSHTSPTYGSPFDMLKRSGITYRAAGENLAGASDVERAHINLMNSPGHRRNILNPNFTHIGIGIVNGGPYGKMYTQTFIGVK